MQIKDAKSVLESEGFAVEQTKADGEGLLGLAEHVVSWREIGAIHTLFVRGDEPMMSTDVDELIANFRDINGEQRPYVLYGDQWERFEKAGMDMRPFVKSQHLPSL